MLFYFKLQFKRANRLLVDLGFNIILGYALIVAVFIITSIMLFEKIELAKYLYAAISILPAYVMGNEKRCEYLKTLFTTNTYTKVRLLENCIISLPFIIFMIYKQVYLTSIIVLIVALALSFFSQRSISALVLPTPFYQKPFEFITGFRKSWFVLLCCLALTIIAVAVNNFNLGVFALLVTQLTCLNFYQKPEPKFYVWIHAFTPAQFLWNKMLTALFHSFIFSLPISGLLLFFYPASWYITLVILLLAVLYLWLSILGKYAYYPTQVNLPQLIAVALSIIIPPFLLISLPYFYVKAKQNLLTAVL